MNLCFANIRTSLKEMRIMIVLLISSQLVFNKVSAQGGKMVTQKQVNYLSRFQVDNVGFSLASKVSNEIKNRPVRIGIVGLQYAEDLTRIVFKEDLLLKLTIEELFPIIQLNVMISDLDLLFTTTYLYKFQIDLKLFK